MFKKIFTLMGAALCCSSLFAGTLVEDYYIDWKTSDWNFYVMGYIPSVVDGILTLEQPYGSHERKDGEIVYTPNTDADEDGQPDPSWYQCFVADGIPTTPGVAYTVIVKAKASEEMNMGFNMGWGWGDGEVLGNSLPLTTEWQEIEVSFGEVGGSACNLVAQPGTSLAKIEIEWIKVTHMDNSKPLVWIDVLTNGDASGDDNSCFWTKQYGVDLYNTDIKEVDGNRVYYVDACAKQEQVWDNQFFITVPEEFAIATGNDFKVAFKYRADKPAKASTQIHSTATNYLHWMAIGDVNFTTEWQEFAKTVTPSKEMNGGRTIAFNLNELEDANVYYFDDITWSITPTEDGLFVAGDYNDWDYENSDVFTWNDGEAYWEATVGTADKPASVVKIATKRGNDNAFNSSTLKANLEEGEFVEFTAASASKIALPCEGIWTLAVDLETEQMACFLEDAGVHAIITEGNVAPVYYNLQGIQIMNPVKGNVYIVKRGNNVSKAIFF